MKNGDQPRSARSGSTRREFLKVVGVAGAGAAAVSCGPPETTDKLIPYLVPPDDIVPGTNTTYATMLRAAGGEPLGVHAWVRDGRVIKLEGNPDLPTSGGGLSALAQSELQSLYDPDRVRAPRHRTSAGSVDASWDDAIQAAGEAVRGGGAVLLTAASSGTSDRFFDEWAAAVGAEHVQYDPFGFEALRAAHEIAFGVSEIPSFEVGRADRIVAFGTDFLETWLAPVEFAAGFARARDVEHGRHAKFTFIGPRLSLTGSNADEWLAARSGAEVLVALALAHVVANRKGGEVARRTAQLLAPYTPEAAAARSGLSAVQIQRLGVEIAEAAAPIALPPGVAAEGADATDAQLAVAILNYVSGAVGTTVRLGAGPRRGTASYADMTRLIGRMKTGEIKTLIVAGVNPAYSLPAAAGFSEALASVPTVIALGSHADETATAAAWILPTHHALEAWGDAEVRPGVHALAQPVMSPIFDTRQAEDILIQVAAASGASFGSDDFAGYLRAAWRELHAEMGGSVGFERWWRRALQRGGVVSAEAPPEAAPALAPAAVAHHFEPVIGSGRGDRLTLIAYPTVQFYDGRGANRSWMQELPDPITKVVWNSWVEIHPEVARPLGITNGSLVEVRSGAGTVKAPAYVYEGIRSDAVAIPLGQGHTAYGRYASGRGVNPLDLMAPHADPRSGTLAMAGTEVEITNTGEHVRLVNTQGSDSDHGREIAELMEVEAAFTAIREHKVDLSALVEAAWDSDPNSPYRWGMTLDLNACTGCGACVTACTAENNVPAVGEELCAQGREMSWIRVERYIEKTADGGIQTVHEPAMCQQCGDAPCEPVCPVYAAYHNPEGLNVQVYNRCVGTRYCANNCPYKQRRFNWFSYDEGPYNSSPYPLSLQLNPDVTVRQKGVMEKCTFCVQRINRAKIAAKQEGRLVADGEIQTACMQSCPTQAIAFGNLKDADSRVSSIARGARAYHVLGELNTRPAVTYLKSVTHASLGEGHGAGEA